MSPAEAFWLAVCVALAYLGSLLVLFCLACLVDVVYPKADLVRRIFLPR